MPCRSHSRCNGLRNLTYEFWGDTIQPMQRIVKKGDWGLYQSPLFWLLLRGGFTPSTSKVASLRAEQFPTAEGEQSGAPNEGTWCKVAERLGLWGSCTPPRLGAQASVHGSGVPSAADPRLPGVWPLSGGLAEEPLFANEISFVWCLWAQTTAHLLETSEKVRICSWQQIKVSFFGWAVTYLHVWSKVCLSHLRDLPFFTWKARRVNTQYLT